MEEKELIRRYLIWCYKTTKEEIDRIDRKFTQLMVDDTVLKNLKGSLRHIGNADLPAYQKHIENFKVYMTQKKTGAVGLKFSNRKHNQLSSNYVYLRNRLKAIEKSISHFLKPSELRSIKSLYEGEMTRRILEAREHT